MGIVGLETAFAVLYTKLVRPGIVPLETVIRALTVNPRERFGLGTTKDYCVFDLNAQYTVDPAEFASKGHSTPFEGEALYGVCRMTVVDGEIAFLQQSLN